MTKPIISDAAKIEAFKFNFSGLEGAGTSDEQIVEWFDAKQDAYYNPGCESSGFQWQAVANDLESDQVNHDCGCEYLADAFEQTEALALRFDAFSSGQQAVKS